MTEYPRRCGPRPYVEKASTGNATFGEKGVRLAQKMHVGPCIPVRIQRQKARLAPRWVHLVGVDDAGGGGVRAVDRPVDVEAGEVDVATHAAGVEHVARHVDLDERGRRHLVEPKARLGLYPIFTLQYMYSSTTIYQVSYHIQ